MPFFKAYYLAISGVLAALGSASLAAAPPRLVTLHTFMGPDGALADAPLTAGPGGLFYGTTSAGGTNGAGTVFVFDPKTHVQTVLYSFTGGVDGKAPYTGLTLTPGGTLYGTTFQGGASGNGTIFSLDPVTGSEATLYSFANPPDGGGPFSTLALATSGLLYGTTVGGGASGYGTAFSFNPATGTETVLHSFQTQDDGFLPTGALVIDGAGTLYGVTEFGGSVNGAGGIYSLDTATGAEKVLFGFDGQSQGANPYGGLVMDGQGFLYGTTQLGGSTYYGTAFRFIPATGQFAVLHHFTGSLHRDHGGEYPLSRLILDATGKSLYGTTLGNVEQNQHKADEEGTVFSIDAATGQTRNLALFDKPNGPKGGVTLGLDGALYGTTVGQGRAGDGTIFRLKP